MTEVYGPPLAPPVDYTRWTMGRMGIPFTFTASAAGLSAIRSARLKVPIEPPLIVVDGTPHGGFRNSLLLLDKSLNERARNPQTAPDPALADMLFANLFTQAVRCFYRDMLSAPQALKPMSTRDVPAWQRWVITGAYPVWSRVLARGLRLAQKNAVEDEDSMKRAFAHIAGHLGDQPFLGGASPGTDDILFASMASPIILPAGHPVPMPELSTLPAGFHETVKRFRDTPAGRLVERAYSSRKGSCAQ